MRNKRLISGVIATILAIAAVTVFSGENTKPTDLNVVPATNAPSSVWQKQHADFRKPTEKELRGALSPLQFEITQQDGTERPFKNKYWDNKQEGIYVDIVSGEPLFSSTDKFKSGTGWPSFTRPIINNAVIEKEDRNFFMRRVELRSPVADSHLGHVFDDGPKSTGLRYCINSASLRFIPQEKLVQEGYQEFMVLFESNEKQ